LFESPNAREGISTIVSVSADSVKAAVAAVRITKCP